MALDLSPLGVTVEIRRADGELVEFDVVGRPRGMFNRTHLHPTQMERLEVVEGALRLITPGTERLIAPGEAAEVPPGTRHRHLAAGRGIGRVRVQRRPGGRTVAFLERLAELSATGQIDRFGFLRPRAMVALVRDFGDAGRPAWPLRTPPGEYAFVDEWDVAAPREAVFDALADARTYPDWWRPVYIGVEAEGEPAVGKVSRQHFKGRLPYHLRTRSRIVRLERPEVIAGEVDGDLRGTGIWTLTERDGGTRVRFDWRVHADRRLLRALSPVLRPALRWNHDWAIARAIDGLEPYARRSAG